jgi:hypothetical protein
MAGTSRLAGRIFTIAGAGKLTQDRGMNVNVAEQAYDRRR